MSAVETVMLVDDKGFKYLIGVSPDDNIKIQTDPAFANFCLRQAIAIGIIPEAPENATSCSDIVQNSNCDNNEVNDTINSVTDEFISHNSGNDKSILRNNTEISQVKEREDFQRGIALDLDLEETNMDDESLLKWNRNSVLLLIDLFSKHKRQLDNSRKKKNVWKKIADGMSERGYSWSGDDCDNKFRNLKKTYKKVKDKGNKTGQGKQTWEFFEEFDEIFGTDHAIAPLNLMNSIKPSSSTSALSDISSVDSISPAISRSTSLLTLGSVSSPSSSRVTSSPLSSRATSSTSLAASPSSGVDDDVELKITKKKRKTAASLTDKPEWFSSWAEKTEQLEKLSQQQNKEFQTELLKRLDSKNETLSKMVDALIKM